MKKCFVILLIGLIGVLVSLSLSGSQKQVTSQEGTSNDLRTPPVAMPPPKGMVLIPAGEFQMGSRYTDNEHPVRTVYVDAFYMDATEVTNAQFKAFLIENPRWQKDRIQKRFHSGGYLYDWNGNNYPVGEANHPARNVSWYTAMVYAKWAGKRLPTEAEWEYAARGGGVGKQYPHGDTITPWDANYGKNVGHTTAVRRYPANGYGLYDMAGNVSEWCLDEWDSDFYAIFSPNDVVRNPLSASNGMVRFLKRSGSIKSSHVLRGGSWRFGAHDARVTNRDSNTATRTHHYIGFRCVRSAKPLTVVNLPNAAATENENAWILDAHLRQTVREALALTPDTSLTPQKLEGVKEAVWMLDAKLRQTVREALALTPGTSLTPQKLAGLTELHAAEQKIWSLEGLAYATSLEALDLDDNRIGDLTPLTHLMDLKKLYLSDNDIQDLTPLAGLTDLEVLYLSDNDIQDLTPLASLTDLEVLHLGYNPGVNIKGLTSLTGLKRLYLYESEIIDAAPLAHLTGLETLNLSGNKIGDLTPLAHLTGLETLNLSGNKIGDLTPLAHLTGLETLNLSGNKIGDLTPLAHLTGLETLNLSGNKIGDLTPLARLTGLTRLDLSSTEVIDLTPLAHLTGLETLELSGNKISDLTSLANLTGLKELYISKTEISDLTPLANLMGLKMLYLRDNEITDITPLIGLNGLEKLDLTGNPTQDITPLYALHNRNPNLSLHSPIPLPEPGLMPDGNLAEAVREALGLGPGSPFTREALQGLTRFSPYTAEQVTDLTGLEHATQLETLSLWDGEISDLTPLANLTGLKELYLPGNEISDLTPLANLTGLETLALWDNEISDLMPLANLTGLKELYLPGNEIGDLTPLANLTRLRTLRLGANKVSDLTPLANLTGLRTLYLGTNQIRDISVLAQLTSLYDLELRSNQISDMRPLAQLTNLSKNLHVLGVQSNPIQDIAPLRTLLKNNPEMTIDVGFIGKSLCPIMYWIDMENGTLHRLIGGTVENLFPDIQNATSLALNHYYYYWSEKTDDNTWKIYHGKKETPSQIREFDEVLTDIPMDMTHTEHKFYVSVSSGKIQRFGSGRYDFEPDFITDVASPKHLAVDILGEKLYWTEETTDGTWQIRCAALDGSNIQLVRALESVPLELGIDSMAGHLYISVVAGKIQRLRVDGSDFQSDFITDLVSPGSMGVDVGGGKLYWTEKDSIWRASLSGENIERVVPGLGRPAHLVLDVRLPIATETQ